MSVLPVTTKTNMKLPVKPSEEDCCNSGCNPCIFDVYEQQLKLYQNFMEKEEVLNLTQNGIDQLQYLEFILLESDLICKEHKILSFKRIISENLKVYWEPGNHFLVKYTDGTVSCSRAYTPIRYSTNCKPDFSILVKNYDNGMVSKYLFNLNPGEKTLWRGPYGLYKITPNKFSRMIMIAQGTGIAPFSTIIEKILENEEDMTKITLYYCCKSDRNILFRDLLNEWRCYWNFTYKIFLSHCSKNIVLKYLEPVIGHKLNKTDLFDLTPFSANDQFLLCGSSKFMNHYKTYLENERVDHQNIVIF